MEDFTLQYTLPGLGTFDYMATGTIESVTEDLMLHITDEHGLAFPVLYIGPNNPIKIVDRQPTTWPRLVEVFKLPAETFDPFHRSAQAEWRKHLECKIDVIPAEPGKGEIMIDLMLKHLPAMLIAIVVVLLVLFGLNWLFGG